jgi:hypothetical protein
VGLRCAAAWRFLGPSRLPHSRQYQRSDHCSIEDACDPHGQSACCAPHGGLDLAVRHFDLEIVTGLETHPDSTATSQAANGAHLIRDLHSHSLNLRSEAAQSQENTTSRHGLFGLCQLDTHTDDFDPQLVLPPAIASLVLVEDLTSL